MRLEDEVEYARGRSKICASLKDTPYRTKHGRCYVFVDGYVGKLCEYQELIMKPHETEKDRLSIKGLPICNKLQV